MKNQSKKHIQKVVETLTIGGRSEKTILNYTCAIHRFLKCFPDTDISTFVESDIVGYIKKNYLAKGCKANTYNMNIAAIKYFYFICFNKEFSNKLLPHAKQTQKIPFVIDKDLFIDIFDDETSLAHRCWLLLAYYSGLRVEEIATLKIENINSKDHKLKILGKRKKERFTFLSDLTIHYLRRYYVANRINKKRGFLFKGYSSGQKHLNSKSITNYFSKLKKKHGLDEDMSFHSLRHSFATNFIKDGGDVFVLKSMLGHSSLNTTSIYVHTGRDFNNLKGVTYGQV